MLSCPSSRVSTRCCTGIRAADTPVIPAAFFPFAVRCSSSMSRIFASRPVLGTFWATGIGIVHRHYR
jgi:hypothetical protein